jgi:hypothetical protein
MVRPEPVEVEEHTDRDARDPDRSCLGAMNHQSGAAPDYIGRNSSYSPDQATDANRDWNGRIEHDSVDPTLKSGYVSRVRGSFCVHRRRGESVGAGSCILFGR